MLGRIILPKLRNGVVLETSQEYIRAGGALTIPALVQNFGILEKAVYADRSQRCIERKIDVAIRW